MRGAWLCANCIQGKTMTIATVTPRILRLDDVLTRTGLSRSTIYELMKTKNFPQSAKLGKHSVGWIEAEVTEWVNHVIAARNENTEPF